jgi:hypothetical protein
MALQSYGSRPLFQFLNPIYKVDRTPWTGDQPVTRSLLTHGTTQTHNKCTQTSMSRDGFEPTIPVFEQAKAVHALDRAATVTGSYCILTHETLFFSSNVIGSTVSRTTRLFIKLIKVYSL